MPIVTHESRAAFDGRQALGWSFHILIGAVMVVAGFSKVFGFAGAARMEGLTLSGPDDRLFLIGVAEIVAAVLLVTPRLLPVGLLVATLYWGGVIVSNIMHDRPMLVPAILFMMVIAGGVLRFTGSRMSLGRRLVSRAPRVATDE
jgi:hypothetical protein